VPRTKSYPDTMGLVHYGTNIYAIKETYGDADSYKTIYCAHDDTMEIYKTLTLASNIDYFCGANGHLWCISQGGDGNSGTVRLVDASTLALVRTTAIGWMPFYYTCDDDALYIPKNGSGVVMGSVTRFAASDGSTSTYNGSIPHLEQTSYGAGVYAVGGKLFWLTNYGGSKEIDRIDPTTMTSEMIWGFIYAPTEMLSDGTYLYFYISTAYQAIRYDFDITHYNSAVAETGLDPYVKPKGIFLYGTNVYVLVGSAVRICGIDMVDTSHAHLGQSESGRSATDGTSVWVETGSWRTSAGRFLLSDWGYVDNVWMWTGTAESNAIWFQEG
jgi:hypothetical protein